MELNHLQLQILADEIYDCSARIFYKRKATQGRPLLIHGWTGCGKTHASRSIHAWFNAVRMSIGPVETRNEEGELDAMIPDSCFVNWPEIVDGFKKDQWEIIERLKSDYLVILDDIGAEHDPSGIGQEKLCQILSRREFKHTIITTNVQPDNFDARWQQRIGSRLFRNTIEVDLRDVPDYGKR
jgi:DNA replication protein DnaC